MVRREVDPQHSDGAPADNPHMGRGTRIGIGAVIVLGLVALYLYNLYNSSWGRVSFVESNGQRTWVVEAENRAVALRGEEVRPR